MAILCFFTVFIFPGSSPTTDHKSHCERCSQAGQTEAGEGEQSSRNIVFSSPTYFLKSLKIVPLQALSKLYKQLKADNMGEDLIVQENK